MSDVHEKLADDLLEGAREIAQFMLGRDDLNSVKKVEHMIRQGHLPVRRTGRKLWARKSQITAALTAPDAAA